MRQTLFLFCFLACVISIVTDDYYHQASENSNELNDVKYKIPLSVLVKKILQKINKENNEIKNYKEAVTRRQKTKSPPLKYWPSFR